MSEQDDSGSGKMSLEEQVRVARTDLEKNFKEFHHLLDDKTLTKNKSTAQKNEEKSKVDRLYKAAVKLDNINVGEGPMALSIIAIREMLKMRDRVNETEYKILTNLKEVKTKLESLERQMGNINEQRGKDR